MTDPGEPNFSDDTPSEEKISQLREAILRTQQLNDKSDEEQALHFAARAKADRERAQARLKLRIFSFFCTFLAVPFAFAGFYGVHKIVEQWPYLVAGILAFIGVLLSSLLSTSRSFLDVDRKRSDFSPSPANAWPFPTSNNLKSDNDKVEVSDTEPPTFADSNEITSTQGLVRKVEKNRMRRDPFEVYFFDLKETLERKADDADEKASILLDKGTGYTKLGIIFFILSIVAWQCLAWVHGFQNYYIYGIVSCSALFIFIEFISAWFLKQYRHYVDTSTYLLRLKAIFDRFMLIHAAIKLDGRSMTLEENARLQMLIELLSKEISWPESYLQKKPDTGFAKEAIDAMTNLTKELKISNIKSEKRPE